MYNQIVKAPLKLTKDILAETCRQSQIQPFRPGSTRHNTETSLLQILQQYSNQRGWIVLVAPDKKLAKAIAKYYQLELHNVLVIHAKQIGDLNETLMRAVTSATCKAVINFATACPTKIDTYRQRAQANNIYFYQAGLHPVTTPH